MPAPHDRRPAGSKGPDAARSRGHLLAVLGPVVGEAGYDLEDVQVSTAGRRRQIKVVIDADGGVDMDAVAVVARLVSDRLDSDPVIEGGSAFGGPYVLEVSSPGVDRALTEPRHWRRAIGRLVAVPAGEQRLTARVESVDDTGVRFDTGERVAWDRLGAGKVQIEFNRAVGGADRDEGEDG